MPSTDGCPLRSVVPVFLVVSLAACGSSGGGTEPTVPNAPNAPSGLTVSSTSSSAIHLSWTDNSIDEDGFELERSPDGSSSWTRIATPTANATSYDDTGLSASTAYYYRIRATSSAGASSYSGTANATTSAPPATPPAAPSGLAASSTSDSAIHLSWTDNSIDEDGFELERSPDGSSGWTPIATPAANATSYDDTGLSASTAYYYRIRATSSAGASSYSGTANATTSAPAVITGGPCTSGATGLTAFRITWLDNSGVAVVRYDVRGLPSSAGFSANAYGYSVGFEPPFVDRYQGVGGLGLDTSDFIDIQFSTAGITSISHATLSIKGRSFTMTNSGSFGWQTFVGSGSTQVDFVKNTVPYAWYSADMTPQIEPGVSALIRIWAKGVSNSLVVSQIELCLDAQ